MKKLFFLAIAVLAVSLTSCGGSQDSKATENQPQADTTEVVAPVTPVENDVDTSAVVEETTVEETAPAPATK